MMELCDDGHEEVCFEDRECPACAAKASMDDLVDAVNALDGDDLYNAAEGFGTLKDAIKEFTPLVGPMDELLLTLTTSVKQLTAPWHDRDSYQAFCTQVEQFGQLMMYVNSIEHDKDEISRWKSMIDTAVDNIGTVKNAVP